MRQVPVIDWLALAWFIAVWAGYAAFAKRHAAKAGSLLATTNRHRHDWMLRTTARENRVVDGFGIGVRGRGGEAGAEAAA